VSRLVSRSVYRMRSLAVSGFSSKSEPAIWSRDTGQWIPCFDNCQLTMIWMLNIKDVTMAMVLLSYLQGIGRAFNNISYKRPLKV